MPRLIDLRGQRFGRLVVEDEPPTPRRRPNGKPSTYWRCRCDCGAIIMTSANSLRKGESTSCGCRWKEHIAHTRGQRFGSLVIIDADPMTKKGERYWLCQCDCGRTCRAAGSNLRRGNTRSCGCKEGSRKHGLSNSTEYAIWNAIRQRCTNPKNRAYKNYGARGVTVCERWRRSFEAFLDDMGFRPSSRHSVERINNDLGYEPGNCRWADRMTQNNNSRSNVKLSYEGKTMTISQWARKMGVNYATLWSRINHGWSPAAALTTPAGPTYQREKPTPP